MTGGGITGIPEVDRAEVRDMLERFPAGMAPETWDEAVFGDRLRWLMEAGYLVPMSDEDRDLISTLPGWLLYGPQHGLPVDWFGPTGVLLPRYRPGGGRHRDFQRLRRRFRVISRVLESFEERIRVFRRDRGLLLFSIWMATVYIVYFALYGAFHDFGLRVHEFSSFLRTAGVFALGWLGLGLAHLGLRLYAVCIARRLDKRLRIKAGVEG